MKTLGRYIGVTIAQHILVVMLVLLALYFFSTFVTEVADVGKGSYSMAAALRYSAMLLPRQSYELFPLVALLGTMLGLGALASSSELTVMRAAGVSVTQVVGAILKTGLLLVLVSVLLGEVVAPPLEKQARIDRGRALAKEFSMNAESGLWVREGDTFINIGLLLAGGRAADISLYQFDAEGRLVHSTLAKQGFYEGKAWRLLNIRHTFFEESRISTKTEREMSWETRLSPQVFDLVTIPPESLSVADLRQYVAYLQQNSLESGQYELSYWVRLVTPFSTAGMILLAIPFVFGSMRSVSVGQRIVVGALLGIGFYLFNSVFSRVGVVYELPPLVSAVTPTLVVFVVWVAMMRRVR